MKESTLPALQPGHELLPGVPAVIDLTALSSDDLRARAKALYFASRVLNVALAETLDFIIEEKKYSDWGFDSFKEYCESEIGMPAPQAYEYVKIFRSLRDNTPLSNEQMGSISTTKANNLKKLADAGLLQEKEKADEWLEHAQDLTLKQVKEQVDRALETASLDRDAPPPSPDHPVKILHFPLFPEQLDVWEQAQSRARTIAESDKPGHILTCICTAFNAEAWDGRQESLAKLCMTLERTFGIKLIAFEPGEDSRVLYGESALSALAAEEDGG